MAEGAYTPASVGPRETGGIREGARLNDEEVEERLSRLEELLARLEMLAGEEGAVARLAISLLADIYGESLKRCFEILGGDPESRLRLSGDELVGHLMMLHGMHPDPTEQRVERALAELARAMDDKAVIELVALEDGIARIRLELSREAAADTSETVRDVILSFAPELSDVVVSKVARPVVTFVPVGALRRRGAP